MNAAVLSRTHPAIIIAAIAVTLLALVFHPAADLGRFATLCAMQLAGYAIFLDWCVRRVDRDAAAFDWNFPVAAALILGSLVFAGRSVKRQ